jgi:predicted metalloprotease with PDZ domain
MSKNILKDEYAKNYGNVYQKGALIGMTLDILLREESQGAYGIRNLMKDLSLKYGQNKPFKDDEILDEIVKMTYPSVGTFFEKHLTGNTAIDYLEFFNKVGVVNQKETIDASYFLDSQNQIFISINNEKQIFFTGRKNTALHALGIKAEDILTAVNGEIITLENARIIIGKSMQWKEGDALTFEIVRDGETLKLEGTVMNGETEIENLVIEDLPENDPKQKLRKAWLKAL